MASNRIFQREESSEDFNEAGLSAQSSSNTDCSSRDRSDDDSDISVSKIKPEDKDTIEKAKKALLARVRTQAKAKIEFKGQNDKDWSALTTFDEYLKDKKPNPLVWLKELVKEYNNDGNLKGVLDKIPSKSGWVHAALPQFHEKQGQKCLLVLGFCPQYAEDTWSLKDTDASLAARQCFGDVFTVALANLFPCAIFLFTRKDCRKVKVNKGNYSKHTPYSNCLGIGKSEAVNLYWAIRLELAIAKKEYNINFEACLAFSTGAQDVAQLLSMNVFEIADPGNIGRKMRSIWLSVAGLKEICRELAQVDGQPPEEIYTVFRSVYNKARPEWKLPRWDDVFPLSKHRIGRMERIAASLDDQETLEFGQSDEIRSRMERKQELGQRQSSQMQQRHRDNAEALNAYARLHRKGMSKEQKNARVKWGKAYYGKNKDDINKRKRKRGAENPLTIEELEKRRVDNSFHARKGWRSLQEELQWVQDEAARRDNNDEEGQGPTVSEEELGSRKAKVEERYERKKRQRREDAARSRQKKREKKEKEEKEEMSSGERIKKEICKKKSQ